MNKTTMKIEDGYLILNNLNNNYKINLADLDSEFKIMEQLKVLATKDWISKTDIGDFIVCVNEVTNINILE